MRIFDCFTFYNELDLLEIRLRELYNHVDYFVIVESNQTFTSRPKHYIFEKAQARYSQWADKIRYIKIQSPNHMNPWDNETEQRDAIMQGCVTAGSDDIIMVSDADEIPRAAAVDYMRSSDAAVFGLRMPLFNFKFNYMRTTPGHYDMWAMATRYNILKNVSPDQLRAARFNMNHYDYRQVSNGHEAIEHGGWHFGYLGDNEYLRDKAQSFSHQEVNTPEFLANIDVAKSIEQRKEWDRSQPNQYEIVDIDGYFPALSNQNASFILPNTGIKALDLLPPFPYNK